MRPPRGPAGAAVIGRAFAIGDPAEPRRWAPSRRPVAAKPSEGCSSSWRRPGSSGGRLTTQGALRRNTFTAIPVLGVVPVLGSLASLLSLIAMITIAVTIRCDAAMHRGWHDDFAGGTTVVRIG